METTTAFVLAILTAVADLVVIFTWLKIEPSHIFSREWWATGPVSITRRKALLIAGFGVLSLGLSSYGFYKSYNSTIAAPRILAWGVGNRQCNVLADTSLLSQFANENYVVLACGVVDPTVDPMNDKHIILSNEFNIYANQQNIAASVTPEFDKFITELPGGLNAPRGFWQKLFLLPKIYDVSQVHQLSDVPKLKGRLF